MPTPTATIFLPYHALDDVILRGTRAAQPAATTVVPGTLYCVTDEGAKVERSSGTAWQVYSPTPGGGGAGTGDVVGPGVATDAAIALYDGTTGKLIQDSALTIPALTASITASVTADVIPVDLATETTGTLPDARLSANVQLKPIAAADLPAHAARHQPGGADAMAVDAVAATGSLRTLGTGANQAAPGNDARFTAPSAPTAHKTTHEPGGTDALTALDAGTLTTGTLPDARLSANVALQNQANVFTAKQELSAATPRLNLIDTAQPANLRKFQILTAGQELQVYAMDDAEGAAAYLFGSERSAIFKAGGVITERNRLVPLGEWSDVPYNPANFTGDGVGGWTVDPGDVVTYAYTLVGQTLTLALDLNATSVTGGGSTELRVTIPGGFQPLRRADTAIWTNNNAVLSHGFASALVGELFVRLFATATAAAWTASVNATGVRAQIVIPIA